jgi:hypothetical protein
MSANFAVTAVVLLHIEFMPAALVLCIWTA